MLTHTVQCRRPGPSGALAWPSKYTIAPAPIYEGRDNFSAFTSMEFAASENEMATVTSRNPDAAALLWHEPRESPIRMQDMIPSTWATRPPTAALVTDHVASRGVESVIKLGLAKRGEHFMFQLGVLGLSHGIDNVQIRSDRLQSSSGGVIDAAVSSPSLGGIDSLGRAFNRSFSVGPNRVGSLWIAIDVNSSAAAGDYRGSLTVSAHPRSAACASVDGCHGAVSSIAKATITIVLTVDHAAPVSDGGDHEPIETLARARWLDSTAGQSTEPAARFQPLLRGADGLSLTSSMVQVMFDDTGLPAEVVLKGQPQSSLLHEPLHFVAVDEHDVRHRFISNSSSIVWSNASTGDVAVWQAQGHADALSLALSMTGEMHAHGAMVFSVNISNVGTSSAALKNLYLRLPFREGAVPYAMGLGKTGGRRPPQWEWRWICAQGHDQGNHMIWAGDPRLGIRLKLMGDRDDVSWDSGLKLVGLADVPESWGGLVHDAQCICAHEHCHLSKCNLTTFRGGVNISAAKDDVVTVAAFSGARQLASRSSLIFNFELLITPALPFSPRVRFAQRYTQQGGAMPLRPPEMKRLIDQLVQSGAVTVNMHQGANINPYINYVTVRAHALPLPSCF